MLELLFWCVENSKQENNNECKGCKEWRKQKQGYVIKPDNLRPRRKTPNDYLFMYDILYHNEPLTRFL